MLTLRSQDHFTDPAFPFWIKQYIQRPYPPHRHEFLEFFYVLSGNLNHVLSTRHATTALRSGDLVFVSPSHWHRFDALGPESSTEAITGIFLQSLLDPFGPSLRSEPDLLDMIFLVPFHDHGLNVLHLSGLTDLRVRLLLTEMVQEFEQRPTGWQLAIRAKLMDLLVTLARTFSAQRKMDHPKAEQVSNARQVIVQCLDFIEKNYTQPITLADFSTRKAGFSKEYFCTLFRSVTGKSFVDYVNELRLRRARELLASTKNSIADICHECGFNDLSYFYRAFRRRTGCSPKEFRQQSNAATEDPIGITETGVNRQAECANDPGEIHKHELEP